VISRLVGLLAALATLVALAIFFWGCALPMVV
jgi:hypothetical protein